MMRSKHILGAAAGLAVMVFSFAIPEMESSEQAHFHVAQRVTRPTVGVLPGPGQGGKSLGYPVYIPVGQPARMRSFARSTARNRGHECLRTPPPQPWTCRSTGTARTTRDRRRPLVRPAWGR